MVIKLNKQAESNHLNGMLQGVPQSGADVEIPEHQLAHITADVFPAGLHGNHRACLHFPVMLLHPDSPLGCLAFSLVSAHVPGKPGQLGTQQDTSCLAAWAFGTARHRAEHQVRHGLGAPLFPSRSIASPFPASCSLGHVHLP